MKPINFQNCSSYLKFSGSKRNILEQTIRAIGGGSSPFYDVFGGSGIVSQTMAEVCPDRQIFMNDASKPLVNLHLNVVEDWQRVFYPAQQMIYEFMSFERGSSRQKQYYEEKRAEFNNLQTGVRAASLLVFLNRTCFNGLYRFNRSGLFNVPVGSYNKIYQPNKEMRKFSNLMRNVNFSDQDCFKFLLSVTDNSVIYMDVPYCNDLGKTTFDYTENPFTPSHQRNLVEIAKTLVETKGCRVLITNHRNSFTEELYKDSKLVYISAKRTISSDGNREDAKEVIAVYG